MVKSYKQFGTFNYNIYRTILYPIINKKHLFSTGSDGCVYETLIPIHPSDPEKNQRVVRSLLLKSVVCGSARSGVAFTVLDQDHIAVLGPPPSASKGN